MKVERRAAVGYSCFVPATAGIGNDSPMRIGAAAPLAIPALFLRPRSINGGRCWEAEKPAGSYSRSVNPTLPIASCLTAVAVDSNRIGVPL